MSEDDSDTEDSAERESLQNLTLVKESGVDALDNIPASHSYKHVYTEHESLLNLTRAKDSGVCEESLPPVKESADRHELRCRIEREDANRFCLWKKEIEERKLYESQAIEEEFAGLPLTEKEARIKRHQRRKHVDAALRLEENYMKNACGEVLFTRKTPTGTVTERIIIPNVRNSLAERVVKFSLPYT